MHPSSTHQAIRLARGFQWMVKPTLTTIHSSNAPKEYPRTTQIPLTTPWYSHSRGINDGVSEKQKTTNASTRPVALNRRP